MSNDQLESTALISIYHLDLYSARFQHCQTIDTSTLDDRETIVTRYLCYTKKGMTEPSRFLSRNVLSKRQFEDVPKTTVIAIAAVATILIVALISGCIFFCYRRRGRKNKLKGYGNTESIDRSINSQHDPVSKIPLMRQDNHSQMSEYQRGPSPRYDEEDDIGMAAPDIPHRTLSGRSMQSLPPSYTAATHAGMARTMSQNSHRPDSSHNGSDGLRPLMLLSRQSYDGSDRGLDEERGRSGYPTKPDRSSLVLPRPVGRPRAGSRFREEDLDM